MRPNHNNKQRMRGRHRNNKPSNPLARSYESNGPDVKVRGNPQHIVEKYSQLARDAQVSGDPVLAEAYLQHAEHYYRIITAAQAAIAQAQGYGRPGEADADENGDDDDDMTGMQQPYPDFRQQQQNFQPRHDPAFADQPPLEGGQPFPQRERPPYHERQDRPQFNDRQDRGERQDRGDRPNYGDRNDRPPFRDRQDRNDRPQFNDRQDRGDRNDRPQFNDRQDRGERQDRGDRQEQGDRRFPPRGPRPDFRPRRSEPETEAQDAALPSFITGGGSRPPHGGDSAPVESPVEAPPPPPGEFEGGEGGDFRAPFRARRRRRPNEGKPDAGASGDAPRAEDQPAE